MPDLPDDINELLESIDAGLVGDRELKRILEAMEDSEAKRMTQIGVQLLRLLEAMNLESIKGGVKRSPKQSG